jgi:hypothetical protein
MASLGNSTTYSEGDPGEIRLTVRIWDAASGNGADTGERAGADEPELALRSVSDEGSLFQQGA